MHYAFDPPPVPSLPVHGSDDRFPVHRIYCIGRNYADHAREMHSETVSRANPVFFMKPADALVPEGGDVPYPPGTHDFQHEVEMVVALGAGGRDLDASRALECVFGYAVGLDLTRRDLQAAMKAKGLPWEVAKSFDHAAPVSMLHAVREIGHPHDARLSLAVNGTVRQDSSIAQMLFAAPEIIAELSKLFELRAGDLIFTGTPSGVGPMVRGDAFHAELEGVASLDGRIV